MPAHLSLITSRIAGLSPADSKRTDCRLTQPQHANLACTMLHRAATSCGSGSSTLSFPSICLFHRRGIVSSTTEATDNIHVGCTVCLRCVWVGHLSVRLCHSLKNTSRVCSLWGRLCSSRQRNMEQLWWCCGFVFGVRFYCCDSSSLLWLDRVSGCLDPR